MKTLDRTTRRNVVTWAALCTVVAASSETLARAFRIPLMGILIVVGIAEIILVILFFRAKRYKGQGPAAAKL